MSNLWKRSLSLLLAMVMIVGMVPVSVFATEEEASAPTEEVVIDEAVAEVQGMINALPESFESAEAVDAFWLVIEAIDAAAAELTEEQQAQLDYTKYDAAIDAAAAFTNPEFDEVATYDPADGYYWGTAATNDEWTLYILNGSITKGQLYTALHTKINNTQSGYKYSSTNFGRATQWISNGAEVTSGANGNADPALTEGTWYIRNAGTAWGSASYSAGSTTTITVKHYYKIGTAVAANSPEGADIKVGGQSSAYVVNGQTIAITVNPVNGYTASVTDSKGNAVTNLDAYAPTESTTLTVTYTSNEVQKYAVTVVEDEASKDWGTATLKSEAELPAGAEALVEVETNTNDDNHKYEVASVKVGDTTLNKNANGYYVYTMGAAEATITVTYKKTAIEKNADPLEKVKFNTKKDVATQLDDLKKSIFEAVVDSGASLPDDITWEDLDYHYYPWAEGKLGSLNVQDFNKETVTTLESAAPDDTWTDYLGGNGLRYFDFAQRFVAGGSANEKVLLTGKAGTEWAGLKVEATITLEDSRLTQTVALTETYTQAAPYEYENADDLHEYMQSIAQVTGNGEFPVGAISAFDCQTALSGTDPQQITYHVDVAETDEYLAVTDAVLTTWVKLKTQPANIVFALGEGNEGSGSVLINNAEPGSTLAAGTYKLTVTPSDLDGSNGSVEYVDSVAVANGTLANAKWENGVYIADLTVANDTTCTVTITYKTASLTNLGNTMKLNGYGSDLRWEGLKANVLKAVFGTDADSDSYTVYVWGDFVGDPTYRDATSKPLTSEYKSRLIVPAYGEVYEHTVKIVKAASSDGKIVALTLTGAKVKTEEIRASLSADTVKYGGKTQKVNTVDEVSIVAGDIAVTAANAGTVGEPVKAGVEGNNVKYSVTVEENQDYVKYEGFVLVPFEINTYTITWMADGKTYDTQTAAYGTAVKSVAVPTKTGYTFDGWDKSIDTITENATITANFKINTYNYTIETYTMGLDGKYGEAVKETKTAEYGASVSVDPEAKEGFSLNAEKNVLSGTIPANNDLVLKVYYDRDQYTITYKDTDNSELKVDTYYYDADVTAYVPTKENHTFNGWEEGSVPGKMPAKNLTFTVKAWIPNAYQITWNVDGALSYSTGKYNATVELPVAPTKEGYTFAGWKVNGDVYTTGWTMGNSDVIAVATWTINSYNYTIETYTMGLDGKYGEAVKETKTAEYGASVSVAPEAKTGFAVADNSVLNGIVPANNGLALKVYYSRNQYTVTWVNGDETTTEECYYGAIPVAPAATKTSDAQYNYTNGTWGEIAAVTGKATYTATFTNVLRSYTVTWIVDGNPTTETYKYGETPEFKGNTDKDTVNSVKYTFTGWDVEPVAVVKNATYTAQYSAELLANNGTVKINKYYTESGNTAALTADPLDEGKNLEQKILAAAGLDPNGDFVVTTTVGIQKINVTATVEVRGDSVVVIATNPSWVPVETANEYAPGILARELNKDSYPFTISNGTLSKEVSMTLVDSRSQAVAVHNGEEYKDYSALNDTLLEEIAKDITANTSEGFSYAWGDNSALDNPLLENTTYTAKVVVTLYEDANYYVDGTQTIEVTVKTPVLTGKIEIPAAAEMDYNTGMALAPADRAGKVLEVLNPVYTPDELADFETTVWYQASTARNVPVTIDLSTMDLGWIQNFLPDSFTAEVWVDALEWQVGVDLPVVEQPSNDRIQEILMDDLIPNYGTEFLSGDMTDARMKQIVKKTLEKYPDVMAYYESLGTHVFGENDVVDADGNVKETVWLTQENNGYGAPVSNECVITLKDLRAETSIKLNTGVTVTYGAFTEAQLKAALVEGVYDANGNRIGGAELVKFDVDVTKLSASENAEVTVKYVGGKDYKGSTATGNIVINKGIVDVKVDNRLIKWEENLSYDLPVSTTPAGVDTVDFLVGLDVADLNVNGGKINGLVGNVQLFLPKELQDLLTSLDDVVNDKLGINISFKDGASMKLSELKGALETIGGLLDAAGFSEWTNVLLNMISSLPTDVADIEITIGGEMPTNIGVYLVGAVSADSNYETNFGVGAVVITPDGVKAELDWKQKDENHIITRSLLTSGAFDLSAVAVKVAEGGDLDAATAQAVELFLGVDINGEIILETEQKNLNVGAYTEIAMIVNWGNQMYYSAPIARAFVVIAENLVVEFVDENGQINNDRLYEFNNLPQDGMQNLAVSYKENDRHGNYMAGDVVTDYDVKYLYAGVQTNGKPYAGTEAPVHAGAYAVTALVTLKDANGEISHAGVAVGALAIEPTTSDVAVENEAIRFDGNGHKVSGLVHASSTVAGLIPDTTIISAGLSADLDNVTGLESINGNVNVDMPTWLDDVMKKLNFLEAGYNDGIKASTFVSYIGKIEEALAEYGVEIETFQAVADVIKQLPENATLTFHEAAYSEVGVYLVVAVVTDSDHYPSAGAGVMVIYPDGEKLELQFEEDWNGNNIFTWTALKDMNLNAKPYKDGDVVTDAIDNVTNLFVGLSDDGEIVLKAVNSAAADAKHELDNGAYSQVAFLLHLGNKMYYAEPIARAFLIVPTPADVIFVDENGNENASRHFVFDNTPKAMDVQVSVNGQIVNDPAGVTIRYVGVQTNGKAYNSTIAPVHAGAYTATATYTARDEQDRLVTLGVAVGAMVIEPTTSDVAVDNAAVRFDGEAHKVSGLVHASSKVAGLTPDTTIISAAVSTDLDNLTGLESIKGNVNIDMPKWLDDVMQKLDILEAGYADGIKASTFLSYIDKIEAGLAELGVEVETFQAVADVIKQLPENATLTFHEAAYSEVGVYLVVAVVTDSDHYPSAGAGVMVIYPDVNEVELQFEEDWNGNNIFTWAQLEGMNLNAKPYKNGQVVTDAIDLVTNLFVGFNDDGKVVLMTVVGENDAKNVLDNGAYSQVAFLLDLGNKMYYAEPISRAFLIVPNPAEVIFVDENGNENADRHFVFDNTGKAMDVQVSIAGNVIDPGKDLTVTYVGVQTNGKAYNSTVAPKHAGAYVVTATYSDRDEQGRLISIGAAVGVMAIEPAQSATVVDNGLHIYNGQPYDVSGLVHADSLTSDVTPDTTVITAAIATDGTFSENGLKAIKGSINVAFPAWLDAIIEANYPELYANGITVEKFRTKLAEYAVALEEKGVSADILDRLTSMLENLPGDRTMTFNANPTAVGAYLVAAIVTDSDHYPSADLGMLVIAPQLIETELKYTDGDANEIYTVDTLKIYDLNADAFVEGAYNQAATDLVENVFLGIDQYGELVTTSDYTTLKPGAYIEFSYLINIDSIMYVAAPIGRDILVVNNMYDVQIQDENGNENTYRQFIYDGNAKEIGTIAIYDQYGNKVTVGAEDTLEIRYVGVDSMGNSYTSMTAPVNAGAYSVIVTFVDYDANGTRIGIGSATGAMLIKKADMDFDLLDTEKLYNGQEQTTDMVNPENSDSFTVIIDRQANVVNFVMEDDMPEVKAMLEDILGKSLDNVSFDELLNAVHTAIDKVQGYEVPEELKAIVDLLPEDMKAELDALVQNEIEPVLLKLAEILEKIEATLPQSGSFVVNGEKPVNVGEYEFYAINYSANYLPEVSEGVLVIKPVDVTVTVADATKVYGQVDPELTYTVEGMQNDEKLNVTISREEGENVGTYAINATVASNPNYNVTVVAGELTITPAQIAAVNVTSKHVYNATEQTATVVVKCGDKVLVEGVDYTISGNTGKNAGKYTVTVEGKGNYAGTLTADWTIEKADVTITIESATITYGEKTPTIVPIYSNELAKAEFAPAITWDAPEYADAGTYGYNVGVHAENTNWNVTFVDGELTVNPAKVVIAINDLTIDNNDAVPELVKGTDYTVTVTAPGVVTDAELGLSFTIDVKMNAEGQIIAGEYAIVPNYTKSNNWVVEVNVAKLTVNVSDEYICWNMQTGVYYNDVTEGLDEADKGQTIQMLKDALHNLDPELAKDEIMIIVHNGLTFDLNGYYVETDNLLSYGVVLDTATGTDSVIADGNIATGGIVISKETSVAFMQLQPDNGNYIPVYDTTTGSYKFFKEMTAGKVNKADGVAIDSYDIYYKGSNSAKVMFRFRILFEDLEAYQVLARTADSNLKVVLNVDWTGVSGFGITYTMADATVKEHAQYQYDTNSGYAMTLTIKGLDSVGSGNIISAVPTIVTDAGVVAEAVKDTDAQVYNIP